MSGYVTDTDKVRILYLAATSMVDDLECKV